ncbi:hypothetical protein B0T22DRAFT_445218 [Podospora appendiculata]|uniref:Uncharacterized protein n=1 Tax=Podospora appendiculata TaxID=314037 RepID=A0AAE0WYJ5_9PEZI|nr:hypothetical protein B0T22DRAFT_446002 [Podospora appendiculata]KAK3681599.1 hypothetical protein B0T22DRAFT_445218 [Podospora appendiculata]
MSLLNLTLAVCKPHGSGGARHWMHILAEDGAKNGTWYHSTGGPHDPGQATPAPHGVVASSDINKVKASAQKIQAKFCQRYCVDVLGDLERKGLVPSGTYDTWYAAMEVDPYSSDGAAA